MDNVEEGLIAPWFGEKGLGIQYRLPDRVKNLLGEFLEEIYEDE